MHGSAAIYETCMAVQENEDHFKYTAMKYIYIEFGTAFNNETKKYSFQLKDNILFLTF